MMTVAHVTYRLSLLNRDSRNTNLFDRNGRIGNGRAQVSSCDRTSRKELTGRWLPADG